MKTSIVSQFQIDNAIIAWGGNNLDICVLYCETENKTFLVLDNSINTCIVREFVDYKSCFAYLYNRNIEQFEKIDGLYQAKSNIFTVEITEELSRIVVVEAKDDDEAYQIVKDRYLNEEYILDETDLCDYEIDVLEF